jgi:hypothetical protein
MAGAQMAAGGAGALGDAVTDAAGEAPSASTSRIKGDVQQLAGLSSLSRLSNKVSGRSSSSERARKYVG